MLTNKERMKKLENAGVNTSKYFNINLPEGLKPGTTISVVINEDGQPVIKAENWNNDTIYNEIFESGYVRNTRLFRRFILAQMFSDLNYVSYDGQYRGYNDCLKRMYGYEYTLSMMTEEVRVLSKLEVKDNESFAERSHFFTKEVVIAVLMDYLAKLNGYVDKLPSKNCKGILYKRIKGVNIFEDDIDKKLYSVVRGYIFRIKHAKNYTEIHRALAAFMSNHVKLPFDTCKSKEWIDAYKGEGAFYTLKNLVMFHNCGIKVDKFDVKFGTKAMNILNEKLVEYKGEGWRMFALMKKVIADNGINTSTYIAEICNK